MKHSALVLVLASMLLAGCAQPAPLSSSSEFSSSVIPSSSSSSSEPEPDPVSEDFNGEFTAYNVDKNKAYSKEFRYESDYFSAPIGEVDPSMTMFAFAMANATKNAERASRIFTAAGFTEHYDDSALKLPAEDNSIGYAIGARKFGSSHHVVVSIRGEEYDKEWAGNFQIAPYDDDPRFNGDHYGFHVAALEVVSGLKAFLEKEGISKPKCLITGFSRGAAVAGLTAAMLIDENSTIAKENLYCYTFETPMGLKAEHNKDAYKTILNFVNENDFMTYLVPGKYGFVRPGTDINIAEGVVQYAPLFAAEGMTRTILSEANDFAGLSIKDPVGNALNSGKDAATFMVGLLTRELTQKELEVGLVSYATPEEYVEHLMPAAATLLSFFFGADLDFSMTDIDFTFIAKAVALLNSLCYEDGINPNPSPSEKYNPHGLYGLVKELLAKKGWKPSGEASSPDKAYDEASISRACDSLQTAIRSLQIGFVKYQMERGGEYSDYKMSLSTFLIAAITNHYFDDRHSFDTCYALLCNFFNE